MRGGARRAAAGLAAACALLAGAGPARAHEPFQITTDARLLGDRLELRLLLADVTAARLCLARDGGPAPRVERATFEALRPTFEACAAGLYAVSAGGQALRPRAARVALTAENDVEARVDYPPPARPPLRLEAVHLRRLLPDPTYGAELTVTGEQTFLGQKLLRADDAALEIPLPAGAGAAPPPVPSLGEYLRLGMRHILTGYDHLLFLFGLLLACRRLRSVLAIVTAFTAAHSITLALAALRLVTLPGRIVEPLIAATIAIVGVENIASARRGATAPDPPRRWALAFGFGLVHGFGFAGALLAIRLGAHEAPLLGPLFAFNLGVEAGQLAVAALLVPILWRLRAWPPFARRGTQVASLLVSAAGLYWLFQRLL